MNRFSLCSLGIWQKVFSQARINRRSMQMKEKLLKDFRPTTPERRTQEEEKKTC
jgi:hypothetical protein